MELFFGNERMGQQEPIYNNQLQNNAFSDLSYQDMQGVHPSRSQSGLQSIMPHPMQNWRENYVGNRSSVYPQVHQTNMADVTGRVGEYGQIPGQGNAAMVSPKKRGFNFPNFGIMGMLRGLGDKFQMSPEKRAEVEGIRGSADQYGWGNLPGTGLQGNIWGTPGGDKVYARDSQGNMILRGKNLQSAFGSDSIEEMLGKKEAWARKRRAKGREFLSTDLNKWLDQIDAAKGGDKTPGPGPEPTPGGQGDYQRAPINRPDPSFSAPSTTGHMGPGGKHYAQGGYMRSRYNQGGRVGILSIF